MSTGTLRCASATFLALFVMTATTVAGQNFKAVSVPATASVFPRCVRAPSGMVGWWPGDGNANDIVGTNNGTLMNGATFAVGKVGLAFSLNGVSSFVTILHRPELNPTTITVDAWIKSQPTGDYQLVIDKSHGAASQNSGWVLQIRPAGVIDFGYCNGSASCPLAKSTTVVTDDAWHLVAGTLDGTTIKIYVDGVLEGSAAYIGTPQPNDRDVHIGMWAGGGRFFKGLVDEVEIFNRALSGAKIRAIYKAGGAGKCRRCTPPPARMVGWWPGDGNANDIVGTNNGTLVGGATFAPGLVGQAFFLDGIAAFVDLGNASTLHVSAGDFTVDAWVLFNALGHPGADRADMSIADKMLVLAGVGNVDGWRLIKQADNRFWFCFGDGDNRCFDPAFTVFSRTLAMTGVWFHVAAVKSSTSFSIYVNGQLEDTRSPVPSFLDTNSANLSIGNNTAYDAHLNGLVDEVELFSRALTAAEIRSIFNSGSAGKCKSPEEFDGDVHVEFDGDVHDD